VNFCTTHSVYRSPLPPSVSISVQHIPTLCTVTFSMLKLRKTNIPLLSRRSIAIKTILVSFCKVVYSLNSFNDLVIYYIILSSCSFHFFKYMLLLYTHWISTNGSILTFCLSLCMLRCGGLHKYYIVQLLFGSSFYQLHYFLKLVKR
jgi:hypothetical protein